MRKKCTLLTDNSLQADIYIGWYEILWSNQLTTWLRFFNSLDVAYCSRSMDPSARSSTRFPCRCLSSLKWTFLPLFRQTCCAAHKVRVATGFLHTLTQAIVTLVSIGKWPRLFIFQTAWHVSAISCDTFRFVGRFIESTFRVLLTGFTINCNIFFWRTRQDLSIMKTLIYSLISVQYTRGMTLTSSGSQRHVIVVIVFGISMFDLNFQNHRTESEGSDEGKSKWRCHGHW